MTSPSPSQTIFYLRHGETTSNRAGRLQGRLDSPLTLRGVQQAIHYGNVLKEHLSNPEATSHTSSLVLHSSPLGRARQTATIIADVLGLAPGSVVLDDLLVEINMGVFQGRTWAEIDRERGITQEKGTSWDYRPEGGETRLEMLDRSRRWMAQPRTQGIHVVVGHGQLSRTIRAAYLGISEVEADALPRHTHGRLYRFADGNITEIPAEVGWPVASVQEKT